MKVLRLLPILFGAGVLLFGIYLVGTHGSVAGIYLPGLLGLPDCTSSSTSPQCAGLGSFGGFSVGTVVAIFGLGILTASIRSGMMRAAMGGTSPNAMPPEISAMLQQATTHMQAVSAMRAPGSPGGPIHPDIVYCSKCGRSNAADAKFCQGCGATMPSPAPPTPPSK